MDWARLDVDYFTNPKVIIAGKSAGILHLIAILWSAKHETDGQIPAPVVASLLDVAGLQRRARLSTVEQLVDAGLWEPKPPHGYVLHDFDLLNGSRSEAHRSRELWRERQRRYRERHQGDVT